MRRPAHHQRGLLILAALAIVAGLSAAFLTGATPFKPVIASARPSFPTNGLNAGRASPRAHIVIIMMENHPFDVIIGSGKAPYITSLANQYVLLTNSYAIRHPSVPNYLALTSGSTQGVTIDCTSCHFPAKNIVSQLEGTGITWKAYMESMPSSCFKGTRAGAYYKRHNPFMYYDDILNSDTRCNKVVPLTQMASDLQSNNLPSFAFVTPNMCNDMHDCSVEIGDSWARNNIPPILSKLGTDGVAILTFDESKGSDGSGCCGGAAQGGHIATIIAGPGAKLATKIPAPVDHYSLLRLIEDNWGLSYLANAATAPPISGWQR